mmetsp:Transcript_17632/g.24807  ORF Transcript_17632/g.24807 Transcript_17632/m.24807 type:complete len:346 (+) Transcript_17632:191-1228(+)
MGDIETPSYLSEDKVQLLWDRYRRWNLVAKGSRADIERWRFIILLCTITGAVCTTLGTQLPSDIAWILSLFGGILLGYVPRIKQNYTSPQRVDEMVRTRTVAEAIKAEIFLYRTGITPYDKPGAATILMNKIDTIDDGVQDLRHLYVMCPADGKPVPPTLTRTSYIDMRVKKQINGYFRREAHIMAKRGRRYALAAKGLSSLAAFVGLVVGSSGGIESGGNMAVAQQQGQQIVVSDSTTSDMDAGQGVIMEQTGFMAVISFMNKYMGVWVAVLTTAAAAISTQMADAKPYETSALFSATAQHLEDVYLALDDKAVPGTTVWEEFVLECERTIAVQYKDWMTKKTS